MPPRAKGPKNQCFRDAGKSCSFHSSRSCHGTAKQLRVIRMIEFPHAKLFYVQYRCPAFHPCSECELVLNRSKQRERSSKRLGRTRRHFLERQITWYVETPKQLRAHSCANAKRCSKTSVSLMLANRYRFAIRNCANGLQNNTTLIFGSKSEFEPEATTDIFYCDILSCGRRLQFSRNIRSCVVARSA